MINILGLGPARPNVTSRLVEQMLQEAETVYTDCPWHPALGEINKDKVVIIPPSTNEHDLSPWLQELLADYSGASSLTFAVCGNPATDSLLPGLFVRIKPELKDDLNLVPGMRLADYFLAERFNLPGSYTQISGVDLALAHTAAVQADKPCYARGIMNEEELLHAVQNLLKIYPSEHQALIISDPQKVEYSFSNLQLGQIADNICQSSEIDIYLPPLEQGSSMAAFQEIVAHLRAPDGCPWDREQTHQSLRSNLLEESYEAVSAIDENDLAGLQEELGDVLLQVFLHAQIASESGSFNITDVVKGIGQKLIRRHPHVFGNVEVDGASAVIRNWEAIKAAERKEKNKKEKGGLLKGVPLALPALSQAQEIQERAARVGFDWKEIEPVWEKVREELQELESSTTAAGKAEEFGDLLFALVNVIRWSKLDAETLLRQTNQKFRERFKYIEEQAGGINKRVDEISFEQLDQWWEDAKNKKTY